MLTTRTCKRCGIEFEGYGRACYCQDCKKIVRAEYVYRWRDANREKYRTYIREYMRDYSKGIKRKCCNTN